MKMQSKSRGFTLVELLIVIGIIGVLAGVLFASFGGATDAARASQCLTNLRALAMAANSRGLSSGVYPSAGSCELRNLGEDGKFGFRSQAGWISWLCQGNYDDGNGNAVSTSHRSNELFPFYGTGNRDDDMFALTNGTLWLTCAGNKALYTCPEHVRYRKNHKLTAPHFSYVMNARFGWDYTKGAQAIAAQYVGIEYGTLKRADKMLMFAELPTVSVEEDANAQDGGEDGDKMKSDSVLQYKDVTSAKGTKGVYASKDAEAESIGFVHTVGKRQRCGHVAFADGHTEKIVWREGGLDPKTLTAYLCRGWDVSVGAAGWNLSQGADEVE